ncbi:MAG: hypothetical protein FWD71_05940 [Oscillospiraceae bacterium]|nr:hypothetical protein [Oscillospiraceae bacterium]
MKKFYISNKNTWYQYFETLKKNRNKRHSSGEFFVEGVRNINELCSNPDANWEISKVICSDENNLSDWARNIIYNFAENLYVLDKNLMEDLSDKENKEEASEIIFIVRMKNENIKDLKLEKSSVVLIFDRPSNKGNLGTIIRSCDSFGTDALIVAGHAVDLYDSETIRATMGSFFRQKVIIEPSFKEITDWAEKQKAIFQGLKITGTSAKTSKPSKPIYSDENFSEDIPAIIIIGNETMGMSSNFYELSDSLLRIPMSDDSSASSLNVSCAASIILYEAFRHKKL